MNVVELFDRIDFWVDRVKSQRYDNTDRGNACNIAIATIVDDRYDNFKNKRRYFFQSIQAIRDQLYTLVKTTPPTVLSPGNIFPFPADYRHEVGLKVNVDGEEWASKATSYNEIYELKDFAFANPIGSEPVHYEDESGVNIYFTGKGTIVNATMSYLRNPATVLVSDTILSAGPFALVVGKTYYVYSGTVTHNSVIYSQGQTFVAVNTAFTGTGTVILIVNCDLPAPLHEEVAKLSAEILLGIAGNYNGKQNMGQETNRT